MSWNITATEHNVFVLGRQPFKVNYRIQRFRDQLHHHQGDVEAECRVISHHPDDGDGDGLRKLDCIIDRTWLFDQENFRPIKLVVFGHNGEWLSVDSCKPSVDICETAYQCFGVSRTSCSIDSTRTSNLVVCMISGFHHEVDENCALRGYKTVSSNFLPTFRDNLSIPSSGFKNPEGFLKMGPIGWTERSVGNYHYSLRSN